MTHRLPLIVLALCPAIALSACGGGGGYGGDLYIDGTKIRETPSLSSLKEGLAGDQDTQPYVVNPLLNAMPQD
jgi:hypothetical protein